MVLNRAADATARPGLSSPAMRGGLVRVETGEAGIEYSVTGAGRPVILLHGFPDSGRLWRNQVPVLADAGFQVIVPDLRGYGRSDKPGTARAVAL
jgi:pimeloyl-ACP methyl ester carboxylesterase